VIDNQCHLTLQDCIFNLEMIHQFKSLPLQAQIPSEMGVVAVISSEQDFEK
jgi:hypothetical protein